MPGEDEVIEFESENKDGKKVGDLKITTVSKRKTITENDDGTCKGGHPPGFLTEGYKIKGQFSVFGDNAKTIEL